MRPIAAPRRRSAGLALLDRLEDVAVVVVELVVLGVDDVVGLGQTVGRVLAGEAAIVGAVDPQRVVLVLALDADRARRLVVDVLAIVGVGALVGAIGFHVVVHSALHGGP